MNKKTVAVCIPTYHGSKILGATLNSLFAQTYQDFVVYISDDTPPSATDERISIVNLLKDFSDKEIFYKANEKNLGYPANLISLIDWCSQDYVFLLAQDDILSEIAIESCMKCFDEMPNIGAVSRPYFWFQEELSKPVRQISKLSGNVPQYIDVKSSINEILHVLVSVSQLTGLMYRKSKLNEQFVDSVFPAHIYPFAGALRDHGVAFLPFHTVAVSIEHSQTRTVSSIYRESPAQAWVDLYEEVFRGDKYEGIRKAGIRDHMGKNYLGLIQIRNYGRYRYFLRECILMIKFRPLNLFSLKFWVSSLGLALVPRFISRRIVDGYKKYYLARRLRTEKLATVSDLW